MIGSQACLQNEVGNHHRWLVPHTLRAHATAIALALGQAAVPHPKPAECKKRGNDIVLASWAGSSNPPC